LLFFIVLLIPAVASAKWRSIPSNRTDNFNSLHVCGENIFLVANNGVVVRYNLKSQQWSTDTVGRAVQLNDVTFLENCRRGFICGGLGAAMVTEDAGYKWRPLSFDTSFYIYEISFLDSMIGFAVGGNAYGQPAMAGMLFRTIDGGQSWDSIPIGGRHFKEVNVYPNGLTTVVGQWKMYISRDTGVTWDTIAAPKGKSANSVAICGKNGLMAGMMGFVARSEDSGRTWIPLDIFDESILIFDIAMLDENRAFAVGSLSGVPEGLILYTDDCGRNWIPEVNDSRGQLNCIKLSGSRLYACGMGGTLIYRDLPIKK
jgi:photosystem II stability/assembly factor-like uncharacterized protein